MTYSLIPEGLSEMTKTIDNPWYNIAKDAVENIMLNGLLDDAGKIGVIVEAMQHAYEQGLAQSLPRRTITGS